MRAWCAMLARHATLDQMVDDPVIATLQVDEPNGAHLCIVRIARACFDGPQFAPHFGDAWTRNFGGTADAVRIESGDPSAGRWLAGVRFKFRCAKFIEKG